MNHDIRKNVGAFPTKRRAASSRPGSSDKWARVARSLPRSNAPHQRLDGVSNEQRRRGLVKSHSLSLRLASWNIGSLTGKYVELAEVMIRRGIKILCLQETKWLGEKARLIGEWGHKLWYTGRDRNKNGVGIILDRQLVDEVVDVRRKGDRILLIKLILGDEAVNVISAYAPQIGLDDASKQQFWEDLDIVMQGIPVEEKIFIGGDFNGHVGNSRSGFENVHGGFGFGDRNDAGNSILDFAVSYDLILANTWFRKLDSHLITYRSGGNASQIDFFMTRRVGRSCCLDCKVIPGECVATQHRLLVLDVRLRRVYRKTRCVLIPRIKWWKLEGDGQIPFVTRLIKEANWEDEVDSNVMWNKMTDCIKRVAKEELGESKGMVPPGKDTSWWNEEVKRTIKNKRMCYRNLGKNRDEVSFEKYKLAKKEAKKAVQEARAKVYQDLYERLDSKEGEKDIYRIARMREKKTRDLGTVKCIKDHNHKVLVKDTDIKERWKEYFDKLFNGNCVQDVGDVNIPPEELNRDFLRRIRPCEVKEALRRMKTRKAVGPDAIPIEVWKCLGEFGVKWLTKLFNKIWQSNKMPDEWRKSTLVPLYKNKGDIQDCSNYRGIKLISHTMKLWERVIEHRLREHAKIAENQFGFMPGRSTMEAIHILRRLIERFRVAKKDLHMIFIDLEKAYDRVPRDVLWWALKKKAVPLKYVSIIKDMYEGVVTNVRTCGGLTDEFPITIGVHQGSALSPFLFAVVMDEITKYIHEDIPWCMLFADDIVLIDETKEGVNKKLELWRQTLEARGFRLSRSKTEYMECKFRKRRNNEQGVITLDGQQIPVTECFKYLGSIIQKDGEIDGDVNHRIKAGWLKWRSATGVLCDRNMPLSLKGKFYRTAVRPSLLYGTECWANKKQHTQKISVAEMRMLRWMCGKTRMDKIRNEDIRSLVGVAPIEDKMRENRLRWFGHLGRRPMDAPVRRVEKIDIEQGKKLRGRPKMTWMEVVKKDMKLLDLEERMVDDRNVWRRRIHVLDRI